MKPVCSLIWRCVVCVCLCNGTQMLRLFLSLLLLLLCVPRMICCRQAATAHQELGCGDCLGGHYVLHYCCMAHKGVP